MTVVERAESYLDRMDLIRPELDRLDKAFPVTEDPDYVPLEPPDEIIMDLLESLKACHDELAWVYRVLQNPMENYEICNSTWPVLVLRAMEVCHSSRLKSQRINELEAQIDRHEERAGLMDQHCPVCGCPQYYSKKRGGWYCPEGLSDQLTKEAEFWRSELQAITAGNLDRLNQIVAMQREIDDLRRANSDLAGAAICPDELQPEYVRAEAVREVLGMVEQRHRWTVEAVCERFGFKAPPQGASHE